MEVGKTLQALAPAEGEEGYSRLRGAVECEIADDTTLLLLDDSVCIHIYHVS